MRRSQKAVLIIGTILFFCAIFFLPFHNARPADADTGLSPSVAQAPTCTQQLADAYAMIRVVSTARTEAEARLAQAVSYSQTLEARISSLEAQVKAASAPKVEKPADSPNRP